MPENTKACSLTKEEVAQLIYYHCDNMRLNTEDGIERINYLNKRLKSFDEVEIVKETPQASEPTTETKGTASW